MDNRIITTDVMEEIFLKEFRPTDPGREVITRKTKNT